MLNISDNSVVSFVKPHRFKSFNLLKKSSRLPLFVITACIIAVHLSMLLPWTQNIQAKGYVTTRLPEQRPQSIESAISGRIETWYVQEGDLVQAGDTILRMSEVKSEYLDPNLRARTSEQVEAKRQSIEAYNLKVKALQQQYADVQQSGKLKISQLENKIMQAHNKISIDSLDLAMYNNNLQVAINQFNRTKELHDKGLKTQTEMQDKELKKQEYAAKVKGQENKLLNTRNELLNLLIEFSSIERDYSAKLSKIQSEEQSALTSKLESVSALSKLSNQLTNYEMRNDLYWVTAPQSGYITKILKKGIGEIVKEGFAVATIMPAKYELAVEVYVKPQDLPLVSNGNVVQLRFDGWPAIVISGWPEASSGVFSGTIRAIDYNISENNYYRVIIVPNTEDRVWPEKLRVGVGVNTFILLKNVPIWYEIWRQLSGFPPDYY